MNTRRTDETLASAARTVSAERDRRAAQGTGQIRDAIGDEIGRPRPSERTEPKARSVASAQFRPRYTIRGMMLSRAKLRQAMILTEILGLPKALRQTTRR